MSAFFAKRKNKINHDLKPSLVFALFGDSNNSIRSNPIIFNLHTVLRGKGLSRLEENCKNFNDF